MTHNFAIKLPLMIILHQEINLQVTQQFKIKNKFFFRAIASSILSA
ncbi:hypothetical protein [Nostoc sp. 106C]|nr:hypothetical protein [Nostoc sp. 106C]